MARPAREDADWFPFYAKDGRTLTILQHRFGLAGIGFFTNLMRLLTQTPRHHVQISDEADAVYTFSRLGCEPDEAEAMIATMVMTGKLDRRLWDGAHVLYSSALVDSLAGLYEKRDTTPPSAEELYREYIGVSGEKTMVSGSETGVSGEKTPSQQGFPGSETPHRTEQDRREQNRTAEEIAADDDFKRWLEKRLAEQAGVRNPGGLAATILKKPNDPKNRHFFEEYRDAIARASPPPAPPGKCDVCGGSELATTSGLCECQDCGRQWALIRGKWNGIAGTGKAPPSDWADDDYEPAVGG